MGPRQSGKTTLAKIVAPDFDYYSFEDPDTRERATIDPRGFLQAIKTSAIFDEIQRVPDLLSYLQSRIDDTQDTRKFLLTGSNNLLLSSQISQSLAGRTRIFHLLPFSFQELSSLDAPLAQWMWKGMYPPIYDKSLDPQQWLADYYQTYVEKDVRMLSNIRNLRQFDRFVRLCAGRAGQLLSMSSLASDVGVSVPTIQSWLSILEASYICFTLSPHFKNFNKRITKSPKLYFYDTGLLCFLLRIASPSDLELHSSYGAIFENWVVLDTLKYYHNSGQQSPLYFWRDQHGHEIDLIIDEGETLFPIEIKSSATFHSDFLKNIHWFNKVRKKQTGMCIYGGQESFVHQEIQVTPWKEIYSEGPILQTNLLPAE